MSKRAQSILGINHYAFGTALIMTLMLKSFSMLGIFTVITKIVQMEALIGFTLITGFIDLVRYHKTHTPSDKKSTQTSPETHSEKYIPSPQKALRRTMIQSVKSTLFLYKKVNTKNRVNQLAATMRQIIDNIPTIVYGCIILSTLVILLASITHASPFLETIVPKLNTTMIVIGIIYCGYLLKNNGE